jgi:hypothetical protein
LEIVQTVDWLLAQAEGFACEPVPQWHYEATFVDGSQRTLPWQHERLDHGQRFARFPSAVEVREVRASDPEPLSLNERGELAELVASMRWPRGEALEAFRSLWLQGRAGLIGFRAAVSASSTRH